MARAAIVLRILIASPSDVEEERQILTQVIHDWNAVHSLQQKLILEPLKWETHSYPSAGQRPQQIINEQIVRHADAVIGIFGVRVGTPTGQALSGTIEEIEELRSEGKHVALYFSDAPVPRHHDRDQLDALEKYRRERAADTLYATYATLEELRHAATRHLPQIVATITDRIRSVGELEQIKHEFAALELLREKPVERFVRPQIKAQFVGEYPDGTTLLLFSTHDITLRSCEYLDKSDVRLLEPESLNQSGRKFQIPIDYSKLVSIGQRHIKNDWDYFHMKLRVDVLFKDQTLSHIIPLALSNAQKRIDGVHTSYIKVNRWT